MYVQKGFPSGAQIGPSAAVGRTRQLVPPALRSLILPSGLLESLLSLARLRRQWEQRSGMGCPPRGACRVGPANARQRGSWESRAPVVATRSPVGSEERSREQWCQSSLSAGISPRSRATKRDSTRRTALWSALSCSDMRSFSSFSPRMSSAALRSSARADWSAADSWDGDCGSSAMSTVALKCAVLQKLPRPERNGRKDEPQNLSARKLLRSSTRAGRQLTTRRSETGCCARAARKLALFLFPARRPRPARARIRVSAPLPRARLLKTQPHLRRRTAACRDAARQPQRPREGAR